jgi:hypothetical protein
MSKSEDTWKKLDNMLVTYLGKYGIITCTYWRVKDS